MYTLISHFQLKYLCLEKSLYMDLLIQEIQTKLPVSQESRRLFHGRGHIFQGYEDIVIDWFDPVVLIICYRQRDKSWLDTLAEQLRQMIPSVEAVLNQQRFLPGTPTEVLYGFLPETVYAYECGLRYQLRLGRAQNIGFFPDMRVARQYVRRIAAGKKILNLFAYTCSFSVAALNGGAERVDNLDMNKGALALGRANHNLNAIDSRCCAFLSLELFRSFSRLRKLAPYDLVICDPPAAQGTSFQGRRDWPKIVKRLASLLAPGGEVIACMSAPELGLDYLQGLFAKFCPQAVLVSKISAGDDFMDIDPDKGLNVLHYRFP